MRIGFFTNNYFPIISGISTSISNFSQGLTRLGHDVHIIAPHFPGYRDATGNIIRVNSLKLFYKAKYPIPLVTPKAIAKIAEKLVMTTENSPTSMVQNSPTLV